MCPRVQDTLIAYMLIAHVHTICCKYPHVGGVIQISDVYAGADFYFAVKYPLQGVY